MAEATAGEAAEGPFSEERFSKMYCEAQAAQRSETYKPYRPRTHTKVGAKTEFSIRGKCGKRPKITRWSLTTLGNLRLHVSAKLCEHHVPNQKRRAVPRKLTKKDLHT
jgi:hypothetical protein